MNRTHRLIVVLMMLSMLMAACAPAVTAPQAPAPAAGETAAPEAPEPVTIKWLQWWDPEYGVEDMQALTDGFTAKYPHIKVERVTVAWGSMYDALVANAQANVSEYDLLGIERVWMVALDKLGGVEPLDDYIAAAPAEWREAIADGAAVKWQGDTKMFCWYMMPYQWAYNVDMLEEAGLEPPDSWDDLPEYACALRDEASGRYGISLPLGMPAWNLLLFYQKLVQLGGTPLDETGHVAFNSPEGVAALEYYKDLLDTGCVTPGSFTEQLAQSREFFAAGNIAMIFDGPFIGSITKQTNPEARVAYAPAWKDVTGGYVWAGSGLAVAGNSTHKDEAWLLLQYLLEEEVTIKMTQSESVPFSSKAAFASLADSEDPILREIPAMLNQDPEHNFFYPPLPNETTLREKFTEQTLAYYAGEKTAQEALDAAAAAWNEEIDKAQ